MNQSSNIDYAKTQLLIIDDDRKLCRLVRDYLEPLGYQVAAAHTGPDGLDLALDESREFEAIILDVMLPGMDGFELLKRLRAGSDTPVLMLTSRGDEADRIVGLEIGADDYLPKTFSTRELLARLRAVTRRAKVKRDPAHSHESEYACGDLRLNEGTHTASQGDTVLTLTAIEFDLLAAFMKAKGRVKSREQLIEDVAHRHFDVFDRSIDVHVSALRKKLNDDAKQPRYIRTIRSVGYLLINPEYS
ncbi:MAG: response regulator transcription factor [Verrucomicrobiae bacterium]|nr:response regulator transcription factor [Verrucomicrobiae bacterium]